MILTEICVRPWTAGGGADLRLVPPTMYAAVACCVSGAAVAAADATLLVTSSHSNISALLRNFTWSTASWYPAISMNSYSATASSEHRKDACSELYLYHVNTEAGTMSTCANVKLVEGVNEDARCKKAGTAAI